jgi:hypothetical protein
MKAIVYAFGPSTFDPFSQALAWRFGFLMADTISVASCYNAIYILQRLKAVTGTTHMLKMMKGHFICDGEEAEADMEDMRQTYKAFVNKKHKHKPDLVIIHKMDKLALDFYKIYLANMEERFRIAGIGKIGDLVDNETFFLNEFNPANAEDTSHKHMGASDVLLSIGRAHEEAPEIFVVFPEYFVGEDVFYSVTDDEAEIVTNAYLHKCFEMPFLNLMTNDELKMVRKEVREPMQQFRTAMDGWINYASTNEAGSLQYFKEKVLPIAEQSEAIINANDLLAYNGKTYHPQLVFEVWIGELPITTIWELNKRMNSVSPATWEILEKAKTEDLFYSRRVPVIALKSRFGGTTAAMEEVQTLVTKKSILID